MTLLNSARAVTREVIKPLMSSALGELPVQKKVVFDHRNGKRDLVNLLQQLAIICGLTDKQKQYIQKDASARMF